MVRLRGLALPPDLEAHMQTPYVKVFMKEVPAIRGEDVDIRSYEMMSLPRALDLSARA
jgi:hypothetical protein